MTAFIYICRLRRIESAIQQTIYRVDKQKPAAALMQDVDAFRARLDKWKAAMPLDARDLPNFDLLMVDGYNNYVSEPLSLSLQAIFLCKPSLTCLS